MISELKTMMSIASSAKYKNKVVKKCDRESKKGQIKKRCERKR